VRRDTRRGGRPRRACCMISEVLEESGIDREKVRWIRRQLLEGIILVCRWQLDRLDEASARAPKPSRKGQRITVD
jgi:hypothetical protein